MGKETDYVCLRTTEVSRQSGVDGYLTGFPATSRYPEQAAGFWIFLYSDRKLAYLLNYGISGEHYEITDWERGLLEPVRDADGNPERILQSLCQNRRYFKALQLRDSGG